MELIRRYIYAVVKRLPKKQRNDIEKELGSTIFDALEDTFGKSVEYTDEQIKIVLKQLGPPWILSSGYQKNSGFIIGPELTNTYYLVIKIAAGAVAFSLLAGFIIGIFDPEITMGSAALQFLKLIPTVIFSIFTVIGFVTLNFFLIERNAAGSGRKYKIAKDDWKPDDLPKVPGDKEKISAAESIAGIVFTLIGIVIFNIFASELGIYYTPTWGEEWRFVQIFSTEAIESYLFCWNVVWIIGLVFHIYCLIQREWNIKTRLFDIFKDILSAGVLLMMVRGPELLDMRALLNDADASAADVLRPLAEFMRYSLDAVFIFVLIAVIIGIIVKAVKLIISAANSSEGI
jgi:hypothetical protein